MDLSALKTEITTDPAGIGYAGKSDADVAGLLNAPNRRAVQPISTDAILRWAAKEGVLGGLRVAEISAQEPIKSIAAAVLLYVQRPEATIDLTDPEIIGMLDALVAAGTVSRDAHDALMIRATVTVSRAKELKLGMVNPHDVASARRL